MAESALLMSVVSCLPHLLFEVWALVVGWACPDVVWDLRPTEPGWREAGDLRAEEDTVDAFGSLTDEMITLPGILTRDGRACLRYLVTKDERSRRTYGDMTGRLIIWYGSAVIGWPGGGWPLGWCAVEFRGAIRDSGVEHPTKFGVPALRRGRVGTFGLRLTGLWFGPLFPSVTLVAPREMERDDIVSFWVAPPPFGADVAFQRGILSIAGLAELDIDDRHHVVVRIRDHPTVPTAADALVSLHRLLSRLSRMDLMREREMLLLRLWFSDSDSAFTVEIGIWRHYWVPSLSIRLARWEGLDLSRWTVGVTTASLAARAESSPF
jgi:hypothetical protein